MVNGVTTAPSILARPVYGVTEAASLLGLRSDRARAWLDGYERSGVDYAPVIREQHTGRGPRDVGRVRGARMPARYRRKGVPLQRLRPVIDELRREFHTPYPLATARPYVYDRELVLDVQERDGLPTQIAIVVRSGQEILLAEGARQFLRKVEFDPGEHCAILRLFPAGPSSPVLIDPLVRFGRPSVSGVSTERLWELADAGETIEEIASGYDLPGEAVRAAVSYEEQFRSLTA